MILRLIDIGITMRRLLAMLVGEVNFDEPSKLLRLEPPPDAFCTYLLADAFRRSLTTYLHALPYHLSLGRFSWPGATDLEVRY